MSETWTIGELAERAADALASVTAEQRNGRVRDVPNERLIRWYTTIGLLDPPLTRKGRIALYGSRHLLQLIAVKRRQAEGRSIAEIQFELTGATDDSLAAIAGLGPPPANAPAASSAPFWATRPQVPVTVEDPLHHAPVPLHGLRLAPGVVLLLDQTTRAPSGGDLAAIAAAARPLLATLADLGLTAAAAEGITS